MRVPRWLVIALGFCLLAASNYPTPNFTQVGAGETTGGASVLPHRVNADPDGVTGHLVVDTGGTATATIAAAAGAATVVSATARRVWSLLVTTAGTVSLICYDNATAASGTIVLETPATTTVGTEYGPVNGGRPLVNGLTCNSGAGAPAGTFSLN